jgi:uncharacterized protein (DUF1800 family)
MRRPIIGWCLLAAWLASSPPSLLAASDADADGVPDGADNCLNAKNPGQLDSDGDGFGNACDPDFNNDGIVNARDLATFRNRFGGTDANADFNGDGRVNSIDLAIFKQYYGKVPGPSGRSSVVNDAEAARFLNQATFGATLEAIQALKSMGTYAAWINDQFERPVSLLLPGARQIYSAGYEYCRTQPYEGCPELSLTEVSTPGVDGLLDTHYDFHRNVWWKNVVEGGDQLRQRVAFALSEILVVSDVPGDLENSAFGVADYYDTLTRHAFGNYRQLLEAVTRLPVMGIYLSLVRSSKADPERNIRPDENFAREVLQLFSIGVHRLNLDGTPMLDGSGNPIPNYGQAEVQEFARAFTGWKFADVLWDDWYAISDRTKPMQADAAHHDPGAKRLLGGVVVPAGQTAEQDLTAALDNIFSHPNLGPFIGRQLIQRLTTSNPSPAYVARVAAAFNDNGTGVRGDLKAVVKAILLDSEARSGIVSQPHFGKLREPLLRVSHVFRAFKAKPVAGATWGVPPTIAVYHSPGVWSGIEHFEQDIGQNVLRSPSVFNFFFPDHAPVGPVRDRGLVAPEFQIATETNVMGLSNTVNFHVQDADLQTPRLWSYLDLSHETSLVADPDALLTHLDTVLTGGGLSAGVRQIIKEHLSSSSFPDTAKGRLAKAKDAISLILDSPDYLIQK